MAGRKKVMTFLVNAPAGAHRRGGSRRASSRKRSGAAKRKPPKGFRTWSAYMASIRPNSGGTAVAKRKRKSTRKAVTRRRRRNPSVAAKPVRRARSRYRRNPMGLSLNGVQNILMGGVKDAALGVAGKSATRFVRSKLGYDGATTVGAAVEVATATALGIAAAKMLGPQHARAIVQGAFMGPIETFIKAANVPFISATLGDEGDFAGVEDSMGGYIRDLGGYPAVTGGGAAPRAVAALGDEVGDEYY